MFPENNMKLFKKPTKKDVCMLVGFLVGLGYAYVIMKESTSPYDIISPLIALILPIFGIIVGSFVGDVLSRK